MGRLPQTGYAEVANGQLYFEIAGRGDPLILVHGNAGDRRHWNHQFMELSSDFMVIRYDVRGFGQSTLPAEGVAYSDYEDLRQLLDRVDVSRAHVAGWSMGSGIAVDLAIAYPERLRSLISIGPWVNGYSSPNAESMFADFSAVGAALQKSGPRAGAQAWMQAPFFAATIREPSAGQEFYEIANDYSWWALMHANPQTPLEPEAAIRLHELDLPTLIVTAEHDIPACHEVAEIMSREIAGSEKVVIGAAGHLMHMEQPIEVNAHVRRFIASVPT